MSLVLLAALILLLALILGLSVSGWFLLLGVAAFVVALRI